VGIAHRHGMAIVYMLSGSARPTKLSSARNRRCWSFVISLWSFRNPRQTTKDRRHLFVA